jgi:hypothetical protein
VAGLIAIAELTVVACIVVGCVGAHVAGFVAAVERARNQVGTVSR